MDEKYFMEVASEVAHRTLLLNYSAIYDEPIERLRLKNAFYLTGMDVSKGTFREDESWRRVEAYRRSREYFRGGPEDWKTLQEMLAFELSNSLSKNFTSLIHFSLMDLAGGGYWSSGKEVEDRVAGHILRASVSFMKRTEFGNLTWITAVKDSLFYPMCSFTGSLLKTLQVEQWRENDGYVNGLKNLGGLVYGAVGYDLLLRERVNVYGVAKWQYDNDFYERQDRYRTLIWSEPDIVDDYAPYGVLIMQYFDKEAGKLEEVVLEGNFHMWRLGLGSEDLMNSALIMKQGLEELTPHTRESCKKYDEVVSEILSGRKKALAAALARVKGLWNGWAGLLLGGLVKVSEEDGILCLQMMKPPFWPCDFDGAAFMRLTAVTLPINRQVVHVCSHMGKLLVEKVKRAGFDKSAEEKPKKRELKKSLKRSRRGLTLYTPKVLGGRAMSCGGYPQGPFLAYTNSFSTRRPSCWGWLTAR